MSSLGIGLSLPVWLTILLMIVGCTVAWWSYRTTLPHLSRSRRRSLTSLRSLALVLLLLTLADAFIAVTSFEEEEPVLVLALDRSGSMQRTDSGISRYERAAGTIARLRELIPEDRRTTLLFADSVFESSIDSVGFASPNGQLTGISRLLDYVPEMPATVPVGGVLLISDGNQTDGRDGLQSARALGLPVFTLAPGHSPSLNDLRITEITTRRNGFLQLRQPVTVRFEADLDRPTTVRLTLSEGARTIASESIRVRAGRGEYNTTFTFQPTRSGDLPLRATIRPLPDEVFVENNNGSTLVQIEDRRRRVLLVAGSPGPDVAFVRRIVERMPEIDLSVSIALGPTVPDIRPEELSNLDLVILVNYPTSSTPEQQASQIARLATEGRTPLLVIPGRSVDRGRLGSLAGLLPMGLEGGWEKARPAQARPVAAAPSTPITREVEKAIDATDWERLPPVSAPTGRLVATPDSQVLLEAESESDRTPLLAVRNSGDLRVVMFGGYDIWRWELFGEGLSEARGDPLFPLLESLVSSSVRWLDVGKRNRRVSIRASRPAYRRGEPVELIGEIYSEEGEPAAGAIVTVRVHGDSSESTLRLAPSAQGMYGGRLDPLPPGLYGYSGSARLGSEVIGSDRGSFIVEERSVEDTTRGNDIEFLRGIAESSGGVWGGDIDLENLVDSIFSHPSMLPRSVESRVESDLRSSWWILLSALALFSLEWYLRKRWGLL